MDKATEMLLREALLASIFVSPLDPGLSYEELMEIGRRAGHKDGTIGDTLRQISYNYRIRDRLMPSDQDIQLAKVFLPQDPEILDFDALDFVIRAVNERIDADGIRSACIDRSVLVERAKTDGLDRTAAEAAITFLVLGEILTESTGNLRPNQIQGRPQPPGEMNRRHRSGPGPGRTIPRPYRQAALASVRDVVARRTDGRPRHADPLDAFPEALDRLGLKNFKLWWTQTVAELRKAEPNSTPVACLVLSAALVEGALTFVVQHARIKGLPVFQSPDFQRGPQTWSINDLIKSAASGNKDAILTQDLRGRADTLAKARQRIHAGRMMVEHPGGPPDLRPEQATDARTTAGLVARAVLDWLDKNPP